MKKQYIKPEVDILHVETVILAGSNVDILHIETVILAGSDGDINFQIEDEGYAD